MQELMSMQMCKDQVDALIALRSKVGVCRNAAESYGIGMEKRIWKQNKDSRLTNGCECRRKDVGNNEERMRIFNRKAPLTRLYFLALTRKQTLR